MAHELRLRGCEVVCQRGIPVKYEGVKMNVGFRADIIVDKKVIIEVKSIAAMAPVHAMQLRTYLRLTELKLGLLINFNTALIKEGIRRFVNNL